MSNKTKCNKCGEGNCSCEVKLSGYFDSISDYMPLVKKTNIQNPFDTISEYIPNNISKQTLKFGGYSPTSDMISRPPTNLPLTFPKPFIQSHEYSETSPIISASTKTQSNEYSETSPLYAPNKTQSNEYSETSPLYAPKKTQSHEYSETSPIISASKKSQSNENLSPFYASKKYQSNMETSPMISPPKQFQSNRFNFVKKNKDF